MHCFVFAPSVLASSDGRLYRCDVSAVLSNGALGLVTDDGASDDDWEEREASRTHSVKFSDPQDHDNREVSYHHYITTLVSNLWLRFRKCFSRTVWHSESYYMLNSMPGSVDYR